MTEELLTKKSSLLAQKAAIDFDLSQCKAGIRESMSDAREKKRFAPVKQYNDLQNKRARLAQDSQKIQKQIIEVNNLMHLKKCADFYSCFVECTKSALSSDEFEQIVKFSHILATLRTTEIELKEKNL